MPYGRLRGEAIYSEKPNTGEAVVVFLNPNNPGVDEDSATFRRGHEWIFKVQFGKSTNEKTSIRWDCK